MMQKHYRVLVFDDKSVLVERYYYPSTQFTEAIRVAEEEKKKNPKNWVEVLQLAGSVEPVSIPSYHFRAATD